MQKQNRANAEQLQDVVDYYAEHADELEENSRLLTFGDVPGFCWLFDLPSALSHDWPDMNTYPAETMRTDLEALSQAGEKAAGDPLSRKGGHRGCAGSAEMGAAAGVSGAECL